MNFEQFNLLLLSILLEDLQLSEVVYFITIILSLLLKRKLSEDDIWENEYPLNILSISLALDLSHFQISRIDNNDEQS